MSEQPDAITLAQIQKANLDTVQRRYPTGTKTLPKDFAPDLSRAERRSLAARARDGGARKSRVRRKR